MVIQKGERERRGLFLRIEMFDERVTTEHYSCYRTKRTTHASLECSTCLFRSNLFPVNPGELDNH